MNRIALLLAVTLGLFLAACGQPLPPDKAAYGGEWRGKDMRLVITPEGMVEYKRERGSGSVEINAPIKRFDGDNIVVGAGPFDTTFVVSKPPYLDDGRWKMTVDGVELTRASGKDEARA